MGNASKEVGIMKKIVILHGWTYSLDKWKEFINLLVKSNYEIEILNIPGLTEKSDAIWDLNKYANWLKTCLGKKKVILLGHSNGGRIAVFFAAKNPQYIEKLILIDSAGVYKNNMPIRLKRAVFGNLAKLGKEIPVLQRFRRIFYKIIDGRDYEEAPLNMRRTMVNLISKDLSPIFQEIKVPTLIIWGKEDRVTPVSDAILMNNLIRNSKLVTIPEAGHAPFYTNPGKVIQIIKND